MFAHLRRLSTTSRVWLLCAALLLANSWGVLHASSHGLHAPAAANHAHDCDGAHQPTHWVDALLGHEQDEDVCAQFDQLSSAWAIDLPSQSWQFIAPLDPEPIVVDPAINPRSGHYLPPARGPPSLI